MEGICYEENANTCQNLRTKTKLHLDITQKTVISQYYVLYAS